jgi:bacterioferritin (cytochrome b1)
MRKLAEQNPDKLIDYLNERLMFERSGVKLYDAIIGRMKASHDASIERMLGQMIEHRDQEKEHEEWLEAQIRELGGSAHEETEHSRLVRRESVGIETVIESDPELPHLFHALLAAELVDNAGWDLLIELAEEAGDRKAKKEFRKRLKEEVEHLAFVRRAVVRFARRRVFAQAVEMPTSP